MDPNVLAECGSHEDIATNYYQDYLDTLRQSNDVNYLGTEIKNIQVELKLLNNESARLTTMRNQGTRTDDSRPPDQQGVSDLLDAYHTDMRLVDDKIRDVNILLRTATRQLNKLRVPVAGGGLQLSALLWLVLIVLIIFIYYFWQELDDYDNGDYDNGDYDNGDYDNGDDDNGDYDNGDE
jgi:hypothetical protein